MAKQKQYPRKFRMKLERIAEAREERQAEAKREGDSKFDPFNTLWRSFLPRNSVHLMSLKVDETLHRMHSNIMMERVSRHQRIVVDPPWEMKGSAVK